MPAPRVALSREWSTWVRKSSINTAPRALTRRTRRVSVRSGHLENVSLRILRRLRRDGRHYGRWHAQEVHAQRHRGGVLHVSSYCKKVKGTRGRRIGTAKKERAPKERSKEHGKRTTDRLLIRRRDMGYNRAGIGIRCRLFGVSKLV